MIRILIISILALILFYNPNTYSQVIIKPLAISKDAGNDSLFFDISQTRSVRILNNNWKAYSEENFKNMIETTVPCVFEGTESLIFETEISLTQAEIHNSIIKLGFLGINSYSEIYLNKLNIYKRYEGESPFEIVLPQDILTSDSPNTITIKVNSKLDSESTIPTLQRFLFPQHSAGIIQDAYLKLIPTANISNLSLSYSFDDKLINANINLSISLDNLKSFTNNFIALQRNDSPQLRVKLIPKSLKGNKYNFDFTIIDVNSDELTKNFQFTIQNPLLWSPEIPNYYVCEIALFYKNQLIDNTKREICFYSLKETSEKTTFNNQPFALLGTTYYLTESELTRQTSYQKIIRDLSLIKTTGFNAVRFAKSYPNPFALKVCRELGLIALIELPLNSIPEEILAKEIFQIRTAHRLKDFIQQYSKYSNSIFLGLGSSYIPNSETTTNFISYLLDNVNGNKYLTYASFIGLQKEKIEGLDLYGLEIYSLEPGDIKEILSNSTTETMLHKYFISEINYPNYIGSASGYLLKNSSEAQAKYFGSIIDLSREKNLSGFFINSLIQYQGVYNSLYGGYSDNNIYKLGLVDGKPRFNSLPYKIIEAKLHQKGKITIPIGTRKAENKLMFIIIALGLSIFLALLINIKKKFQEDCTRALFRPYNFFADIRDHRILSGIQTVILMLIEASSISLCFTILLFYLRTNLLLEKILLSFGEEKIISIVSYLAWNPENSFFYLFIIMLIKFIVISLAIKLASLFIKTRVEFLSILYMVVWAFFPFIILLPIELILYKILALSIFSTLAIIFLVILFLWILHRILQGVYVLFDARRFPVYAYSILIIIVFAGGILLYYQIANSTLYYIINAIKQYNFMSF